MWWTKTIQHAFCSKSADWCSAVVVVLRRYLLFLPQQLVDFVCIVHCIVLWSKSFVLLHLLLRNNPKHVEKNSSFILKPQKLNFHDKGTLRHSLLLLFWQCRVGPEKCSTCVNFGLSFIWRFCFSNTSVLFLLSNLSTVAWLVWLISAESRDLAL